MKLTPARLDLLRAIHNGDVVRVYPVGRMARPFSRRIMPDGQHRKVTRAVDQLREANLCYPKYATSPSFYAPRVWVLTPHGIAVISEGTQQ